MYQLFCGTFLSHTECSFLMELQCFPVFVDHADDEVVVVAVVAVELGVEDANLGLAGAVEAQRHERVRQPLPVSPLVEVSWR